MITLGDFRSIWCLDFEFRQSGGDLPEVHCLVARELRSGRVVRQWVPDDPSSPFGPFDDRDLFVAYYSSAEWVCFLQLGWALPVRVLDLFCEFRNLTNGQAQALGSGLLGALACYGIPSIDHSGKDRWRELAMRGGPFTDAEREGLVDYCQSDVDSLAMLLPKMFRDDSDVSYALLRGRYMLAAARMEFEGIPVDVDMLEILRQNWESVKLKITADVAGEYGCFRPTSAPAVDPDTQFGVAVLSAASANKLDPYELAAVANQIWRESKDVNKDFYKAKRVARLKTGLTARRIDQWVDRGYDYTSWPRLDVVSSELAGIFPELGLNDGSGEPFESKLWELLSDPEDSQPPRHSPRIIGEATDRLLSDGFSPADCGPLSFSRDLFAEYLIRERIPWPRLDSGALALDRDTFRQMSRAYPQIAALHELLHNLGQLRLNDLAVGRDGRNRCMLSAFRARTGRNQPSNSRYIFGPSAWLRHLITPAPGRAVAYIDWSQQEVGVAAALSGDPRMMEAYQSTDPYITFGVQAGLVPDGATKDSHPRERQLLKACVLGVSYGMGEKSLAASLGEPACVGRQLLQMHRDTYKVYWRWSQSAVDHFILLGKLQTVFGWTLHRSPNINPRAVQNFPMQANGAEIMRLAACFLTEAGINVCGPIHDAFLIEDSEANIEESVAKSQDLMRQAGEIVLDGFRLQSDAEIIHHPDRYVDPRGVKMWDTVVQIVGECPQQSVPF